MNHSKAATPSHEPLIASLKTMAENNQNMENSMGRVNLISDEDYARIHPGMKKKKPPITTYIDMSTAIFEGPSTSTGVGARCLYNPARGDTFFNYYEEESYSDEYNSSSSDDSDRRMSNLNTCYQRQGYTKNIILEAGKKVLLVTNIFKNTISKKHNDEGKEGSSSSVSSTTQLEPHKLGILQANYRKLQKFCSKMTNTDATQRVSGSAKRKCSKPVDNNQIA